MSAGRDDDDVDPVRVGLALRAVRRRLRWRQADVARRAGLSQQTVSDIERGLVARVGMRQLLRVAAALGADIDLAVRWRGGALDRLLDERHASLCSAVARRLAKSGWEVVVEASYSYYGERGSIDVLAWRPSSATILIVEVKTQLTSIEATLRRHDEKLRLASKVAQDRFGACARTVAGLLVLPDDATARRRVARFETLLRAAYPLRGRAAWADLARPSRPVRGIVFLSPTAGTGGNGIPGSRIRRRAA